ncbi:hypothetical protein DB43_DS00400 [Parachlamydia acanthamoebae]|uniref:Uncharacterized protein n=1 Tax=Parachlamydia acanthamoebae TaxID=83552 RepID=A0A0C1EF17_9BACT|nr:hypothetical protein DB43_DS00400 [Parachlamydia acanthamoebae]
MIRINVKKEKNTVFAPPILALTFAFEKKEKEEFESRTHLSSERRLKGNLMKRIE